MTNCSYGYKENCNQKSSQLKIKCETGFFSLCIVGDVPRRCMCVGVTHTMSNHDMLGAARSKVKGHRGPFGDQSYSLHLLDLIKES